ncbi:threonine/serine exporter family protein [Devriesea agamarum]|uniref:threonine/serine ThrE exporter family protein n=1 Tax=Devriesea agamarum TaxID=472569 RepID=UPI00071D564F|nr:threonine/serine exporter family protein [Devriesea agamarum]
MTDKPETAGRAVAPTSTRSAVPTTTHPVPALADSLTVRSEASAAVGATLLGAGMASYRVKWAMARTAHALGLDSFHSIVTFTDITATATLDGRYRTRITQPSHSGVDVAVQWSTQRMVETLPDGVRAAEIYRQLDDIKSRPPQWSRLVNALAAGVACTGFSFLNHGGPVEMIGVFIAATIGQAFRKTLQRRVWNHVLITILAGLITSIVYLLAVGVPTALGWIGPGHESGYLAAVLFLVPGFPMITGVLDMVRQDFSAGIARLAYSVMIVLAGAASIWVVAEAAGVAGHGSPGLMLPFVWELPLRAVATFVGVFGFAVIFNSPWKIAIIASSISLVANSLRYALSENGMPLQLATLFATVLIGIASWVVARTVHVPRMSISVPAVVIMIPGFTMYKAYSMLSSGADSGVTQALVLGFDAVQVVLAAALGLALAHLATSPAWRRHENPV